MSCLAYILARMHDNFPKISIGKQKKKFPFPALQLFPSPIRTIRPRGASDQPTLTFSIQRHAMVPHILSIDAVGVMYRKGISGKASRSCYLLYASI